MATSNLEAIGRARTIGELNEIPTNFGDTIRKLMIPTEYRDDEAGVRLNYRVSILELIKAVSKVDLGLDKVDNTPDLEKPVSNPTKAELAKKFDKTTDSAADIRGLTEMLEKYRHKDVLIPQADVQGLVDALASFALRVHSHSRSEPWLANILLDFAPINHTHKLTTLTGWTEFSQDLMVALNDRPTKAEVNQSIDDKLTARNVLEVKTNQWNFG